VLRERLREARSTTGIVYSKLDVKSWIARTPSVDEARPARCPACDSASRPIGGLLVLVGHGLRARQQCGPLEPDGTPVAIVLLLRRYLCLHCGAVATVVPRGVAPRRHYSALAVAWALALFGLLRRPAPEVRRRTSPSRIVGEAARTDWVTLRRWCYAARSALPALASLTLRQAAARRAQSLVAAAPPALSHLDLAARAFWGAMHTA